jgi:hypothetical protein
MASPKDQAAISTGSVIVASKDQVSSDLAGEAILLSLKTATYYGLDQVGARIWELVQQPVKVGDVRDAIVSEYDVEIERCERDVLELVRRLASEGLIEVRDGPEPAA